MRSIKGVFAIILLSCVSAFAQTGSISGTITTQINGQPLSGVSVQISQLRISVETDANGRYKFTNVPNGRYTVITHKDGFSDQTRSVTVSGNALTKVDFAMSIGSIREEVTVSATGSEESVFETVKSVNAVGSLRIAEQASTSVGEILDKEAGVGKRSFGPGSSRPVIRGFDGDRVLVLQDGVRNGSVGSQSGDHGEPVDALGLERLEIIKGPATLLYGSNAIGGVVNAVTTDEDDPHPGLRGYFTTLGGTNNRQGSVSGGVEYGWDKWVLKGHGTGMREGDMRTPLGRIPNSSSRSFGTGGSLGYFGDKVFLSGSYSYDRRRYGIPYAALFEEGKLLVDDDGDPCVTDGKGKGDCQYDPFAIQRWFRNELPETPDEEIDIAMRSHNFRLKGGFRDVGGAISRGNFSVNYTRYRHNEVETEDGIDEVKTRFYNDTFSYRGFFEQAKYKRLSGRFGFEGFTRNYRVEGAEALIDGRVRQNNFAAFGLQEIDFDRVALQFGGRIETNRYSPENLSEYFKRNFTGFSGSAAARFRLWEGGAFVASFTSSYRSPALEELYNDGPHIGTVTYEEGNQNLARERSNGVEFSLRHRTKRVRLNSSFFHYRIDNFVFLKYVDSDGDGRIDVDDNLPVAEFDQENASFTGADASLDVDVNSWMTLFVNADTVKAELRDNRTRLPRITPARMRFGAEMRYKGLSLRPELQLTAKRTLGNVFPLETATDSYALVNVNGSYTILRGRAAHTLFAGTTNLGNKLYRNHLSFIKDLIPEPGRGFRFGYSVRFF
ncbi:MAG: TonB-dependent receptor [Acidobacteriota bacterium]|nr:MAG: TonB-dependent receptor [Acidobacteriota bacterium]